MRAVQISDRAALRIGGGALGGFRHMFGHLWPDLVGDGTSFRLAASGVSWAKAAAMKVA
tara:strand:+ start:331 stop:507 length:177 start_codon:yes stop_codon:yes gene_type:complete